MPPPNVAPSASLSSVATTRGVFLERSAIAAGVPSHRGTRPFDPAGNPPLAWDAANLRITHHPAAHALLTAPHRPGWQVPAA